MKRILRTGIAVLLASAVAALPEAASANCTQHRSRHWHIITHGETGNNVQPLDDRVGQLGANGNPDEPWLQWVQFCRDDGWPDNQYGIYANRTGAYWGSHDGYLLDADFPEVQLWRGSAFLVERYHDSIWWEIKWQAPWSDGSQWGFVSPLPLPFDALITGFGVPEDGNVLFKISPSTLVGPGS